MPAQTLSPECRLAFRTAGPGDPAADAAATVREGVDWTRTVYIAEKEVAATALWRALERSGAEVPPEVVERLRRQAMVTDFRMMHLSSRLQETVRSLRAHGVPAMLLKGAAIGALVDPTFRARPMNDIDLLVRREDLPRAHAAILAAGWPANENRTQHELLASHHHLPPYFDARIPDLRLELHVALLPAAEGVAIDEEECWAMSRPAPAPFEGAQVPSPEHLLLHAAMHFAWSHTMHFGAWRTFRLANALIEGRLVHWPRFVALASRSGGRSSAFWTLQLARSLSGVRVDGRVLEELAVPPQPWLRALLERYFIAGIATGEAPTSPSLRVSRTLWRVAMRPGSAAGDGEHEGHWKHDARWAHTTASDATVASAAGAAAGPPADAPESSLARVIRHVRGFRNWWDFARRTLAARD